MALARIYDRKELNFFDLRYKLINKYGKDGVKYF
jgi:hypothetical protein